MSTPSDYPRAIWPLLSCHKSLHLWQAVDDSFALVHCVLQVKFVTSVCLADAVAIAGACTLIKAMVDRGGRHATKQDGPCT